ncbi:MAG: nucleotide pyrophosphohydrolase [Patescibacteria group bacterium]
MELRKLIDRGIEVREKYHKLEEELYGAAWGREQVMEGFVGDVGALMKIVMAKEGYRQLGDKDVDKELAHELSDCLWSLLVLASKYNVDIEKEFLNTMKYLDERITNKERH